MKKRNSTSLSVLGWREWVQLPELKVPAIKAKIDTGARTSCLHTSTSTTYRKGGRELVRFILHPIQGTLFPQIECVADIVDRRNITDSGGHREMRIVIVTNIQIGECCYPIELTLSSREKMRFRMLLGRTALKGKFAVDPARSFLLGKSLKFRYPDSPQEIA
ncbi:MAG: ATP-dependent zinc protease [Chitinivibrionales bacterium]|nr:ATP-dependent zinc protease [Chitinivibrionales bacterium]